MALRFLSWAALILIAMAAAGCASGSAIVTGTVRAPISPDQVTIYLEPPGEFETIGLVNASSDSGWTEQGSVDYAIQELKEQAAKLGEKRGQVHFRRKHGSECTFFDDELRIRVHPARVTGSSTRGKA